MQSVFLAVLVGGSTAMSTKYKIKNTENTKYKILKHNLFLLSPGGGINSNVNTPMGGAPDSVADRYVFYSKKKS